MKPEEARQLANGVFREHCDHCPACILYDGTPRTLGKLCYRGAELFKEAVKPQKFGGQKS